MPKSKRRKQTNYQKVQARKRKTPEILDRQDAAVRRIYAQAMPEKQEYPPTLRDDKPHKPSAPPYNRTRERERRIRQEAARELKRLHG